jgi:hypothetical protein
LADIFSGSGGGGYFILYRRRRSLEKGITVVRLVAVMFVVSRRCLGSPMERSEAAAASSM